ncbi:MAG: type 4 prepilin peptidase 1 [Acidobacteriales bacterium]|nr:type 4 prepilin peptidase 1 [Terriglobales bacterium]
MPSSACPNCGSGIKPYDNVPVFGWLFLRGRCRNCKRPISPRYVVVELLTGVLFVVSFLTFGLSAEAIKYCVFSFLIVGLIFTDADLKLLPDAMTLPGMGLGLLFSLFITISGAAWVGNHAAGFLDALPFELRWRAASFLAAVLGAAFGSFTIWGIGELYKLVRGVEGMGFGDVKLMAMVGAFLGVKLTLLTLLLGSMLGSIAGMFALLSVLAKRLKRYRASSKGRRKAWTSAQLVLRRYEMPFGVFLGSMALFSSYFGERIMNWYLGFYQ